MPLRLRPLVIAFALFSSSLVAKADSCSNLPGNLVSNCGFEAGAFTSWTGSATTDLNSGVDTFSPYDGVYSAFLGTLAETSALTQTLNTIAGTQYTLQFALMNDTDPGTGQNSFAVLFGNQLLFSETNAAADAYTLYTLTALADGPTMDLSFLSRNDSGFFNLDDVSVVSNATAAATPEPSSVALLGTGLLGMVGLVRRRLQADV